MSEPFVSFWRRSTRTAAVGSALTGVITRIARQFGVGDQTLRNWVAQAEIDRGRRSGTSSADAQRITQLEREVRELRRANHTLKAASVFFATELDGLSLSTGIGPTVLRRALAA